MQASGARKRANKRLLVAAIGVATVSYVGTQSGCAPDTDDPNQSESTAPYDDEPAAIGESQQGLTVQQIDVNSTIIKRLPTSGNLMAPPPIITSGNLVPPPSGNLMAPPVLDRFQQLEAQELERAQFERVR